MSGKVQGWNLYQREAFSIVNPDQLKAVCGKCDSHNTTTLRRNETDEKAFGCYDCGCVTKEDDAKFQLVPSG